MSENKPVKKKKKPEMHKNAFPENLHKKIYNMAEKLAMFGYSNKSIAEMLDIHEKTFYDWMKKDLKFNEAVEAGRNGANLDVVKALYDRARGCCVLRKEKGFNLGNGQGVEVVSVYEEIPPDVEACKYILSTRYPDLWNQKKIIEMSGRIDNVVTTYELPVSNRFDKKNIIDNEEDEEIE
jgi:hypothetical protein